MNYFYSSPWGEGLILFTAISPVYILVVNRKPQILFKWRNSCKISLCSNCCLFLSFGIMFWSLIYVMTCGSFLFIVKRRPQFLFVYSLADVIWVVLCLGIMNTCFMNIWGHACFVCMCDFALLGSHLEVELLGHIVTLGMCSITCVMCKLLVTCIILHHFSRVSKKKKKKKTIWCECYRILMESSY
jgi:hypothetical protein